MSGAGCSAVLRADSSAVGAVPVLSAVSSAMHRPVLSSAVLSADGAESGVKCSAMSSAVG